MGILRLLLAIGVIAEHAGVAFGVGSFTAVEAFFMISGFYMSLILGNGSYRTLPFYLSRGLRIFPSWSLGRFSCWRPDSAFSMWPSPST